MTGQTKLPENVHVSNHPCLLAKLSQLRSNSSSARDVKALINEISLIVGCEALAKGLTVVPGPTVCLLPPSDRSQAHKLSGQNPSRVRISDAHNATRDNLPGPHPPVRLGHGRRYLAIFTTIPHQLLTTSSAPNPPPRTSPSPPPRPVQRTRHALPSRILQQPAEPHPDPVRILGRRLPSRHPPGPRHRYRRNVRGGHPNPQGMGRPAHHRAGRHRRRFGCR